MAIGSNLPPQAYTRETLTQAFNWLQGQPESVKKLAPNPDSLVAIYRRSLRYGGNLDTENEAPVSSQNFISDLKNLAEGLKQFEEPPKQVPPPTARVFVPPAQPSFVPPAQPSFVPLAQPSHAPPVDMSHSSLNELHPVSRQMLDDLKVQLNLTSDIEAINLMIAIAYKNLKKTLL